MASATTTTLFTPFHACPDPTSVFMTGSLKSTLYKTRYTIEHRQGLAALLGDPGLGKSTVMRYLFSQISALPNIRSVFIPNPKFSSDFQALKKICFEFGVEFKRSMLQQQIAFESYLMEQYAAGVNVVIFIDDAHKLDYDQLELVRTILNFETDKEKLAQIVMAGNLDLRDRLLQKKLKPLLSRIFAPSLLNPLSIEELRGVLQVRCQQEDIAWPFEDGALCRVYEFSAGVPRTALEVCSFAYEQMRTRGDAFVTEALMSETINSMKITDNGE